MTGRELSDKLNYLGMERRIRRLALEDKMETAEKIGLVKKDKMNEYKSLVKIISR